MQDFTYYVKDVYGKPMMYPADKEQAHGLALITGHKTITEAVKEGLEVLGFTLKEVPRLNSDN